MPSSRRLKLTLVCCCVAFGCAQAPVGNSVVPGTIGLLLRQAPAGLEVSALRPGGPAERAGIRLGDVVVSYNGVDVRGIREFRRLVLDSAPGSMVTLTVARDGAAQRLRVPVEQLDLAPGA